MSFTEAEKRKWHADRQAGYAPDGADEALPLLVCGHCGNPFPDGAGVTTEDFSLCDECNGD